MFTEESMFTICNLRDSIVIFNESVGTPSIEILNKKSRNVIITNKGTMK